MFRLLHHTNGLTFQAIRTRLRSAFYCCNATGSGMKGYTNAHSVTVVQQGSLQMCSTWIPQSHTTQLLQRTNAPCNMVMGTRERSQYIFFLMFNKTTIMISRGSQMVRWMY